MLKKTLLALVVMSTLIPAIATANPGANVDVVGPYTSDVYQHNFTAGDVVAIKVTADGDADLDVIVRDPLGRIVAEDISLDTSAEVCFVALISGRYTIEVKNCSDQSSAYVIALNHGPLDPD